MTGDRDDEDPGPPWHERTSTLVAASIGGLAVIGILFLLVSYMTKDSNAPLQAPLYFPDEPSASSSYRSSSATTNTETVTSTSPPVTTDINPSDGSTTSSTSSSDTSGSETTTTRRTHETTDGPGTTRSRPRLNETRTLYPRP